MPLVVSWLSWVELNGHGCTLSQLVHKLLPEGVFNHAMSYLFYSPDVKHPWPKFKNFIPSWLYTRPPPLPGEEYLHYSGDSNSKSDFRSLLLQLSNSLTGKELQLLKFLCRDVVPRDKLETIDHGFKLFEALEHLNKLSVRDRDFLASKLIAVNRTDLRNQLLEIEG